MAITILIDEVPYFDLSNIDRERDRIKVTLEDGAVGYFGLTNPEIGHEDWLYLDFDRSPAFHEILKQEWDKVDITDRIQGEVAAIAFAWKPGRYANMSAAEKPMQRGLHLVVQVRYRLDGSGSLSREYRLGIIASVEITTIEAIDAGEMDDLSVSSKRQTVDTVVVRVTLDELFGPQPSSQSGESAN